MLPGGVLLGSTLQCLPVDGSINQSSTAGSFDYRDANDERGLQTTMQSEEKRATTATTKAMVMMKGGEMKRKKEWKTLAKKDAQNCGDKGWSRVRAGAICCWVRKLCRGDLSWSCHFWGWLPCPATQRLCPLKHSAGAHWGDDGEGGAGRDMKRQVPATFVDGT